MCKRSRPGAATIRNLIRKTPRLGPRTEPSQIVEPKLRCAEPGKLGSRVPVEMAQQPIADPAVRNRAQLLLDPLERHSKRGPAGEGLVQVERTSIEPQRK